MVAGGGRRSCAQVLCNSRLSPASWFSDNLAGNAHLYYAVNTCVIECYDDNDVKIACQVVCFLWDLAEL